MTLPTESQWGRYSALCARLRPLPALERAAALQALRAQGEDDPQVLSLVDLHFALPPDPDRLRTGERLGNYTKVAGEVSQRLPQGMVQRHRESGLCRTRISCVASVKRP